VKKADIQLFIGMTGCGKSTLIASKLRPFKRRIIFDTDQIDHSDGFVFYDMNELKRHWQNVYEKSFSLIYRPRKPEEEFEELCYLCLKDKNLVLVGEELASLCSSHRIGESFRDIVFRGRKEDIHFFTTMLRPKGVHRDVTSQATDIYIFTIDEPDDLKYLESRMPSGVEEMVKALGEYEYVRWSKETGELTIGKETL